MEQILLDGAPEAVALRASMVIGHGSRSFDFLASIVERLPVLALPAWRDNRTRPIDARDVVEYLARAGTALELQGPRTYDVGGATLMRSLAHTLIPDDRAARDAFDLVPRSYDEAVRWALAERASAPAAA